MEKKTNLFVLHIDGQKFNLTRKTLNRYQNSVLFKCIEGIDNNDRIYTQQNENYLDVFIDADLDSMSFIVSYLRGYPIELKDIPMQLKKKIYYDSKYFNLDDITEFFEDYGKNDIFLNNLQNKNNFTQNEQGEELLENYSDNSIQSSNGNSSKMSEIDSDDLDAITFDEKNKTDINLLYDNNKQILNSSLDTTVLLNNNILDINKFINNIQEKLNTNEGLDIVNMLSTDKIICDLLKKFNNEFLEIDNNSFSSDNKQTKDSTKI
ncbi:Hypothetical protein KVN_LOCUS514 [uncultured virus]|nr:Hypothetical protein KVN_LOCUS514 [uncultured virus]